MKETVASLWDVHRMDTKEMSSVLAGTDKYGAVNRSEADIERELHRVRDAAYKQKNENGMEMI
jgi:hypothetical protein